MDYKIDYESIQLTQIEKDRAYFLAYRMLSKHGYWVAIYHCMTLMIWCRNNGKARWYEDELSDIKFWLEVRELIHRTR